MSPAAPPRLPEVVAKLHALLEPLDGPVRLRAIRSVLAMFDDVGVGDALAVAAPSAAAASSSDEFSRFTPGKRAQAWLRKHSITEAMLEQVFHAENGRAELIATPPGETKRDQTINCYMLMGAKEFLATDEPRFSDADALALCKRSGCYDQANHASTRGRFGNRFSGTKGTGYVVTAPGLDQVAAIIRTIASGG